MIKKIKIPAFAFKPVYKENTTKEIINRQDDVLEIVKRAKKNLLLKVEVKGPCATCISKLVCYGCRANAHIYLGDIKASDPKCFYNPDAPNKCL